VAEDRLEQNGRDVCRGIIRAIAVTFEGEVPCSCGEYAGKVQTATGHTILCPVDEATRLELAMAGIV
jgi:hypothetical protein